MTVSISGSSLPTGAVVGGAGGVAAVIGAFIAWETISAFGMSESLSGWSGSNGGKIIAALGVVAVAIAIAWVRAIRLPRSPAALMVVAGVLMLLVGILNYSSVNDDVSKANVILAGAASVGVGLYLDLAAGVAIIVGGALGLRAKKS